MPLHPHQRRSLLATLLLVLVATVAAAQERRPNIVLLIGDDHSWPHAGYMGDPYVSTPNLDGLAASGTAFVNGHTPASTCVPSLRTLLSGLHSERWDAERSALEDRLGDAGYRQEVQHYRTMPRELTRSGYSTWEGGKLWEGTFRQAGFTHGLAIAPSPNLYSSIGDHFGREGWNEGTALDPLRAFLDQVGTEPFFTWIAPLLPHAPFDAPQSFRQRYVDLGLSEYEIRYYANVSWFDALAGEVLAELETRGLREDTLVVYVVDNGVGITQLAAGQGRGKGTLYELGFRTPILFSWPGHVPSGVQRDDLVSTFDIPATILDYAGVRSLIDREGRSLKGAIATGVPIGLERFVSHYDGGPDPASGYFVRTPQWRYIADATGREQLYAIADDPHETVDLATVYPELLPQFRADVVAWESDLATARPLLAASGRLTDAAGAPVSGDTLELVGQSVDGKPVSLRVRTSPLGFFEFDAVPHGQYRIRSRRRAGILYFDARGGAVTVKLPVGTLSSHMEITTTAPRVPAPEGTAAIGGVVRDALGQPVEGAVVTVKGRAPKLVQVVLRTRADGTYLAESLPPGTYRVMAKPQRGRRVTSVPLAITTGARVTQNLSL